MRLSLLLAAAMFLAAPAIAQQSNAPLNLEQQAALRGSILSATQAADFKRSKQILEVYRTLRAAGVTLTSAEAFDMGECARARGLSGEAADAFALLKSDDLEYRENGAFIEHVQRNAALDRDGGVEKSADLARRRNDDYFSISVAEAFAGQGEFDRAVPFYETALSHNLPGKNDVDARAAEASRLYQRSIEFYQLEFKERPCGWSGSAPLRFCPDELATAQLNYGISLFKLKRVDEARATWSAITGSPCVEILAKAWIDIADRSAN